MAQLNGYVALNMVDPLPVFGSLIEATSTRIVVDNGLQYFAVYHGSNFQYNANQDIIGGTLMGYEEYNGTSLTVSLTGFFMSATTAYQLIIASDLPGMLSIALDGNDTVRGSRFGDSLRGFDGHDLIKGAGGGDWISGDRGNDHLRGGGGGDKLIGGAGHDKLVGQTGNDLLKGGGGNDILIGGPGSDTLVGGPGADRFVFAPKHGTAVIKDYQNDIDTLDLTAFGFTSIKEAKSFASNVNGDVVFDFGGELLVVEDMSKALLTADDFLI